MNANNLSQLKEFYFQREIGHTLVRRPEDLQTPTAPRIRYLIGGNGIFLESTNGILYVRKRLAECRIKGLLDIDAVFDLRIPKVPPWVLQQISETATAYAFSYVPLESMFYIYYATRDGTFHVIEPEQERQVTRVSYDVLPDELGGLVKVADVHSHQFAPAYLSATDRSSSSGFGLYGVIGNLHKRAQFVLYLGLYGEFFPLSSDLVFERPDTAVDGEGLLAL